MHTHALGDFAYRLVVFVAEAPNVLIMARYAARVSTNAKKSPAFDIAFIQCLCLLRQEVGDQGREANGQSDDARLRLHDELLYLGLLSSLGGDLRGEALATRAASPKPVETMCFISVPSFLLLWTRAGCCFSKYYCNYRANE